MDQTTQLRLSAPADPPSGGFFYCEHCNHVADLADECEVNQTYKCPRCKKWAVKWRFESPVRPLPPNSVIAAGWFARMWEVVE